MRSFKKLVACLSSLVMCLSLVPVGASAETSVNVESTSIQQVSNQDVLTQLLGIGFDQEEATYIMDSLSTDEILSILGTNSNPVSRSSTSSVTYSLAHSTYSNVSSWNTDGSCCSVASAIFLVYYSCYHYPEILYTSPYNLYLSLKPYIETANVRSSTMSLLESGLINYLNDHDDDELCLGDAVRSIIYNSSNSTILLRKMCLTISAHMNSDEPIIAAGVYTNGGNHAVVIESIEVGRDSDGNMDLDNTYIYVNNGYGGTHYKLNLKSFLGNNFMGIVYFL